jgi:hypothetical protein
MAKARNTPEMKMITELTIKPWPYVAVSRVMLRSP